MDKALQMQVKMDAEGRCEWAGLRPFAARARKVVGGFSRWALDSAGAARLAVLRKACPLAWEEAVAAARVIGVDPASVFAANVCYDASTSCYACTAFSIDGPAGPIHAHCLDWEDNAGLLAENAATSTFVDDAGKTLFVSAGWPGFLGVLIGTAPGRFAISLNAAWSEEAPGLGEPVGFLLRRTLATAPDFDAAVTLLARAPLACDCILLVTGTRKEEAAVIERTPSRAAIRRPDAGLLLATNHYCVLDAGSNSPGYEPTGREPFGEGSRERYAAAQSRLALRPPRTAQACFSLLATPPFTNDLTVQRVTMCASTGGFRSAPTARPHPEKADAR